MTKEKGGAAMHYYHVLANGFFILASMSVFASFYGWMMEDMWLASTQWLLVAIIFLLMAIYTRISTIDDDELLKKRPKREPIFGNTKSSIKSPKATSEMKSFRLSTPVKKTSGPTKKPVHKSFRLSE